MDDRHRKLRKRGSGWRYYFPAVAMVLALMLLWEFGVWLGGIAPWLLPAPSRIVRAGLESRSLLGEHTWQTIQETLLGFASALVLGVGLGVAIDLSPLLRRALYPLLVSSQTVPTVAIAPLLVIWLGYGIWAKVIVVMLVCFFPIVVNTADGLRSADPELIALLRTMGASRWKVFWKVRLPGAMPMIFSGIKVGITYSVVGAILGEWVGASQGLGVFMLRATNSFRTDWVFVSIALTAIMSLLLFGLVTVIERVSLSWYYAVRQQERWEEV